MALCDVPVVWTDEHQIPGAQPGFTFNAAKDPVTGSPVSILSDAVRWSGLVGVYTPAGLRVRNIGRWVHEDAEKVLDDAQDAASTWATTQRISDVVNRWLLDVVGTGVDTIEQRDDSVKRYGTRSVTLDNEPLWNGNVVNYTLQRRVYRSDDYTDPPTRITASYRILTTDHHAHRLIPFDRAAQDAQEYLVLRVSHSVTVDTWDVNVSAVEAEAISDFATYYPDTY